MHKTLSLFTGAGGLDLGLEQAGFTPVLCVEQDERCRETLELQTSWRLAERKSVDDYTPEELAEEAAVDPGELDLIAGGPPCQPFSKSAYWVNGDSLRMDDPRARTLVRFLDIVEFLRPRAILIENVKGMAYAGKSEALEYVTARLRQINEKHSTAYALPDDPMVLNAASYGVPQRRERLFLIASHDGSIFKRPPSTHFPPDEAEASEKEAFLTAWDAIGDLTISPSELSDLAVTSRHACWLPSIPEGENYLFHTPRGGGAPKWGWRRRYWSFLLKLAKDQPSWTITANPGSGTGPFHWDNRRLSIAELAALQTFPDTHRFEGSYREQHRQVGNAVPAALGELLGFEIRRQLFGEEVEHRLTLIPSRSKRKPPSTPLGPLPDEAKRLEGQPLPTPHPGEGQGPGVKARSRTTAITEPS